MEQIIHEGSGSVLQVGDWGQQRLRGRELHNGIKGADNSAQTLEMGEKDEELGNLLSSCSSFLDTQKVGTLSPSSWKPLWRCLQGSEHVC